MTRAIHSLRQNRLAVATALALAILVVVLAVTYRTWSPWAAGQLATDASSEDHDEHEHADDPHEDDHDHAGHSDATSIELSPGGLKNIDYEPVTVELSTYVRSVTMPAVVVERPGRSQVHVTAPLTGVVTKINPIEGAAVVPGSELFEIRLTHEELVAAQRDYVRTAESLDVVNREIERLKGLGEGVVAGKRILEQEYERQKLEASLEAERQALLLHGLSDAHVKAILHDRKLLQTITVHAPSHDDNEEACKEDHLFHVQQLPVKPGQQVEVGATLCVLADHCELYIEGHAFEDDAAKLREAAGQGWHVSASVLVGDRETDPIAGLSLLYLADQVDQQSRAFRFYVSLPNEVVLDRTTERGHRFVQWRFKPGQRMQLHVPLAQWEDRIVLPVEAIVDEGAETYVYQKNGSHFDRVPVHVEHRDRTSVVVANDGSILPGDVVAGRGAYQMHLSLKNRSGSGIDPHAGHDH
jgi:multidrug efflux pump subunit AcrA (membrane-fusion protein)